MTVEQEKLVDIISLDNQTGSVLLTISDHLDWFDSLKHQSILQNKLNTYLAFVESGEILQTYPKANGRPVTIKIVFKHGPDLEGRKFLARARRAVEAAGITLKCELFAESYDN